MTMTVAARIPDNWISSRAEPASRDATIDTMRGIAILMVIGIHSLPQPLDTSWPTIIDAALRPCVPIFLFASGYLTARSNRVPLGKRVMATLVPYAIAFTAAYVYMAWHNPAMDHRFTTTMARFLLAYVFVYYYVFVYLGCTVGLWLVFRCANINARDASQRLVTFLGLSIIFGLIAGSYLDPLLSRAGFSESLVQEARLRDIPFWFTFASLGVLFGKAGGETALRNMRSVILGATLIAYLIYAAIRITNLGDAADYDSVAFFGYAALFSVLLLAFQPRPPFLATIGSGSYFIYLWHIFIVMMLRDHTSLRGYGAFPDFVATYIITTLVSVTGLLTIRRIMPPRTLRWLGA
ncbi:acyltransferase family protein [Afipia massiliensis]|nr:acyltransferase [Afipia massiliensis]